MDGFKRLLQVGLLVFVCYHLAYSDTFDGTFMGLVAVGAIILLTGDFKKE